ncbi:MAG: hypothetical protein ACP5IK_01400 [Candidatus Micrarchaeia archaeon]
MDFFKAYLDAKRQGFGNAQIRIASAERPHISLSSLRANFVEIGYGQSAMVEYAEKRYVLAKSLDYDLLISIYDVNSGHVFAFRAIKQEDMKKLLYNFIKKLKKPNLELRAIGMQNLREGYGTDLLANIELAYTTLKPNVKLVELDLFGNETRHIAIDAKTGSSNDVLIYDRFYKPGELTTQTSLEQFQSLVAHPTKV